MILPIYVPRAGDNQSIMKHIKNGHDFDYMKRGGKFTTVALRIRLNQQKESIRLHGETPRSYKLSPRDSGV